MKRLLYLAALSMVATLMLAPAALAQTRGPSGADGSFNCSDFDEQGQAQQFFNQDLSDPNGLDADDDGQACEELPTVTQEGTIPGEGESVPATSAQYQQYAPVTPVPVEPALPETGGPALLLPVAGLLLATGLLGLVVRRRS